MKSAYQISYERIEPIIFGCCAAVLAVQFVLSDHGPGIYILFENSNSNVTAPAREQKQ